MLLVSFSKQKQLVNRRKLPPFFVNYKNRISSDPETIALSTNVIYNMSVLNQENN